MPLYQILAIGLLFLGASLLLAELLPLTRSDAFSDSKAEGRGRRSIRLRFRKRP